MDAHDLPPLSTARVFWPRPPHAMWQVADLLRAADYDLATGRIDQCLHERIVRHACAIRERLEPRDLMPGPVRRQLSRATH